MKNKQKYLYIIAGANGSGKSTLASELLPEEKLEFLNADEIAKEISPQNIESVRISAGKEVYKRLDFFLANNVSFAIETTLAGNNHIKTIKRARNLNYQIALIYSFVDSPEMCIKRIKTRVLNGGHNIPDGDVIRRFFRSKDNFWFKYKDIVDEWAIFYNGEVQFVQVAKSDNSKVEILNESLYNEFTKGIKK